MTAAKSTKPAAKKAATKTAAKRAPKAAKAGTPTPIVAVKGFDRNLRCRDFQYAIGETYTHAGEVKACDSGFHACEHPLDVFGYYAPAESRFCLVELSGEMSREPGGDSKIAAASIAIKAELTIPQIVSRAVEWVMSRCAPANAEHTSGDYGAASSTGDYGAASSTGYSGAASSTGVRGAASSTGDYGAASSTGMRGAASSTGNYGAASSTGDCGAASSTGYSGAASSTGYSGVACGLGFACRAMAAETGAIVLVHRASDGSIAHIRASKVGENGIKPNVFYTLSAAGEFEEVEG